MFLVLPLSLTEHISIQQPTHPSAHTRNDSRELHRLAVTVFSHKHYTQRHTHATHWMTSMQDAHIATGCSADDRLLQVRGSCVVHFYISLDSLCPCVRVYACLWLLQNFHHVFSCLFDILFALHIQLFSIEFDLCTAGTCDVLYNSSIQMP